MDMLLNKETKQIRIMWHDSYIFYWSVKWPHKYLLAVCEAYQSLYQSFPFPSKSNFDSIQ